LGAYRIPPETGLLIPSVYSNYHYRMTLEEARLAIIEGINYAAYKETGSSLHDSDKNRLLGSEHYRSGRDVVKPSPWAGGDFEEKMATLLRWANTLKRSVAAFTEAQNLLEDEDSVIGRVIRCAKRGTEANKGARKRWEPWPRQASLRLWSLGCGAVLFSVASAAGYIEYVGQGIVVGDLFGLRGREADVAAAQKWATCWLLASVSCLAGSIVTAAFALPFYADASRLSRFIARFVLASIFSTVLTALIVLVAFSIITSLHRSVVH